MQINYYINNQEVNRPLNWKELSIELNFDKDDIGTSAVSLTEFEWGLGDSTDGNDAANLINAHRESGLNGGVGVFEGLAFRIELTNNNTTYQLFDGYLDTAGAIYDCDKIITTAVEKKNIDWLNEVADSKSYAKLFEDGVVLQSDFVNVPYVISEIPDSKNALLAVISFAFLLDTIVREIKTIIRDTQGLTAWPNGSDAVKLALQAVYIVSLVVFLVSVVKQIINLLIQKVKYHSGMSELKLAQRGAEAFGYTFKSSILENGPYKDSYIIPEKYNNVVEDNNRFDINALLGGLNLGNVPNAANTVINTLGNSKKNVVREGYFKGTVGDLFRALKTKYNAKIIISGNELRLERMDYNNSAYNYVIPDVDKDDYKLNKSELKSNYTVEFLTDLNDKNTLQNYEGTFTQVITSPIGVNNPDLVLISGLEQYTIPFARAVRKNGLTSIEKIAKFYLTLIDGYINFYVLLINGILLVIDTLLEAIRLVATILGLKVPKINIPRLEYSNLAGTIEDRIGMMLLENDFISIPKNVILQVNADARQTNVSTTDTTYTNSEYLYNNFHFINSFVPRSSRPNANQHLIYEGIRVPFCFDDYELLRNNNFLKDADGREGELLSATWNVENEVAELNYKINQLYTNNLEEKIITPDGQ